MGFIIWLPAALPLPANVAELQLNFDVRRMYNIIVWHFHLFHPGDGVFQAWRRVVPFGQIKRRVLQMAAFSLHHESFTRITWESTALR